jgi:hypothetical protein
MALGARAPGQVQARLPHRHAHPAARPVSEVVTAVIQPYSSDSRIGVDVAAVGGFPVLL